MEQPAELDQNTAENAESQTLSHQQMCKANKLSKAGTTEQWHCLSLPLMGIIAHGCHRGNISFMLSNIITWNTKENITSIAIFWALHNLMIQKFCSFLAEVSSSPLSAN